MNTRRISSAIFVLSAAISLLSAGVPGSVPAGPNSTALDSNLALGTWKFTGKDKAGVVWTGNLVIAKADPNTVNPDRCVAQGDLKIENADGAGKGIFSGIQFDSAKRLVILGEDSDYGGTVYTAVLSADGKSLTKGVWKETDRLTADKKKPIISEGKWSATLAD